MHDRQASARSIIQRVLKRTVTAVPALMLPVVQLGFGYMVPLHRVIGLRVRSLPTDTTPVVLHLPFRKRNCNGANTVHGGVILALAESVHGFALAFALRDRHTGMRVFTKVAQLNYLKKATSDLFVRFAIDPQTLARISEQLHASGKAEVQLSSTVTDSSGTPIAELSATYHVSWRGPDAPASRSSASSQPASEHARSGVAGF
jgi:uncharacterized protein (TIGR00369 family)